MRALSLKQASRCETAVGHVCKCRCHGALHGAARVLAPDVQNLEAFFAALPPDDPHHRITKEMQRKGVQYTLPVP